MRDRADGGRRRAAARLKAAVMLAGALVLLLPAIAHGAEFLVTSPADPGDGTCDLNECTLREAITAAEANPDSGDGDVIELPWDDGSLTVYLKSALPDLTSKLWIDGPGASDFSIEGEGFDDPYRIFTITNTADVVISGLEITGGEAPSGGGIAVQEEGKLLLYGVSVRDNRATGTEADGGGIRNSGSLEVYNSTILDNEAVSQGPSAVGGGISSTKDGTLIVRNSTVVFNTAEAEGTALGAGINLSSGADHEIKNATITSNEVIAPGGAGAALALDDAIASVQSTIIHSYEDIGSACDTRSGATLNSLGHNLASDTSCELTQQGDQQGLSPRLGELDSYGGAILTYPPTPNSPAIDAGVAAGSDEDERGFDRTVNHPEVPDAPGSDGTDIGAYEVKDLPISDLELTIAGPTGPVPVGRPFEYLATVTHSGPDWPDETRVRVSLPPELAFNAAGSDEDCDERTGASGKYVVCDVVSFDDAGVAMVVVSVTPMAAADPVVVNAAAFNFNFDPEGAEASTETKLVSLHCAGRPATIVATPGSPTKGTAGADVIVGTPGRDVIRAKGGRDVVCGRGGADRIAGGAGRDDLRGQGGHDRIAGGGDADRLRGGGGRDQLSGGPGRDRLHGGGGRDRCRGGGGRDRERSCER